MDWTDLDATQTTNGARFTDFQGTRPPAGFGTLDAEWRAVRESAGLIDARHRGLLSLSGSDRVAFLQGQLTNDVSKLGDGEGIYAALLTIQGRIVSDLYVLAGAERVWLDVPAARADAVRAALERVIVADDVEFEEGGLAPLFSIEGPRAIELVGKVVGSSLELSPCQHREAAIDGVGVRLAALSQTGEPALRVSGPPASAAQLWRMAQAAGATPVGLDALNVLRLEAGIPWHGIDMDEDTLVMEVGLDDAISFKKGCYLGQEVVERVAARGRVNRALCGLIGSATAVPPAGTALTHEGHEVGQITSAVRSPALRAVIALGYVHRSALAIGTVLHAVVDPTPIEMRIADRHFLRPAQASAKEEAVHGQPTGQTVPV